MSLLPPDSDYAYLLERRTGWRRFLRSSDERAKAAGPTAAQHSCCKRSVGTVAPTANEHLDELVSVVN